MFGVVDPFGTGFGDSGLAFSSARALRLDNSLLYQSPKFGGFQLGGGYSWNASGQELAGSGNNLDVAFAGVNFAAGPFFAAITYDRLDIPNAPDNQANLQLGVTFDLKFVKLHAGYAKENDQRVFNVAGITTGADADAWMAWPDDSAVWRSLMASYTDYDGDRVQLTPTTFDERDFKNLRPSATPIRSRAGPTST